MKWPVTNLKHGMKYTPEYRVWVGIKTRVFNPNSKDFNRYSPLEHDDVLTSFTAFIAEVGNRPGPNYSIDRIDNRVGYQHGNLRWATRSEQQRNTKRSARVWIKGIVFDCGSDAAKHFDVSNHTIFRWCRGEYDARRDHFEAPKAWAWLEKKYD